MIPDFPEFVSLDLKHIPEIVRLSRGLPGYSDFNPVSMLAWDVDCNTLISKLDNNLVVMFRDYSTASRFLSIHGKTCSEDSVVQILSFAENQGIEPTLKLVAEEVAQKLIHSERLSILPDPNNYDYVVSLTEMVALSGKKHRRFRQQYNLFTNRYASDSSLVSLELDNNVHRRELFDVFFMRESQKPCNNANAELAALNRCITLHKYFNIHAIGLRIHGKLEAFVIVEKTKQYALEHFKKANVRYPGIYQYLLGAYFKQLHAEGYTTLNIEQDLGIKELRIAKNYLKASYLKKYHIRKAQLQRSAPKQDLQRLYSQAGRR